MLILTSISLLLSLFLHDLWCNSVHISDSFLCECFPSSLLSSIIRLILYCSYKVSNFELFQAISNAFSTCLSVVWLDGSVSLFSSIVRSQGWNTYLSSDIQLIGAWGSSGIKPVTIIRSKFFGAWSLNYSNPLDKI